MGNIRAVGPLLGDGNWTPGAVATNPADQAVLVDTGALPAANYLIHVTGAGSVAWVYDIQHRNAANSANIAVQRRRCAAGNEDLILGNKLTLAKDERIRCVLQGTIVGEVQMSILFQDVG